MNLSIPDFVPGKIRQVRSIRNSGGIINEISRL